MPNQIEIYIAQTLPESDRYDIIFYVDGGWEVGCFDGKQFMSLHGRYYFPEEIKAWFYAPKIEEI